MTLQDKLYHKANEMRQLGDELLLHSQELMALAESLTPANKLLPVPWISQLGKDAAFAPGDCGPACLASWLLYLGHDGVTPDDVSANVNLPRGYRYTMPAHIIRAARAWDVDLYWRKNLFMDDIRAEIDGGQPVIVLVHYGSLPQTAKFDPSYRAGHWLLVVGYDDYYFTYLDPYADGIERGTTIIPQVDFLTAWSKNHLDGNSNRQALRIR